MSSRTEVAWTVLVLLAVATTTRAAPLCQPGTYINTQGLCVPCGVGFYNDKEGASFCTFCAAGTYSATTGQTSCTACAPGTAEDSLGSASCDTCQLGTYSSFSGSTACTACSPGKYADFLGSSACADCPSNYFTPNYGATTCTQCPAGTGSSPGATSCTSQPGGQCPFGYAFFFGQCRPCPAGTFSADTSAVQCTNCAAGFYQDMTASSTCLACAAGSFSDAYGSVSCNRCPLGTFQNDSAAVACETCPPGTAAPQVGASACSDCSPGRFANAAGQSECSDCPANTYAPASGLTSCLACEAGKMSDPGAASCSTSPGSNCRAGQYVSSLNICTDCAAGRFNNVAGATQCATCTPGTFSGPGAEYCQPCMSGMFAANAGATDCAYCPIGTSSQAGAAACTVCPAGYYGESMGMMYCKECSYGTYSSKAGSSACSQCQPGYLGDARKLLACNACPSNTYTPSKGSVACMSCAVNPQQYALPGSDACSPLVPTVTLLSLEPSHVPAVGADITIVGRGFPSDATTLSVFVNHQQAKVTGNTTVLTVSVPPGVGSAVSVVARVALASGTMSSNVLLLSYDAPFIASITPATGPTSGGILVTAGGTNFGSQPSVIIGGVNARVNSASDSHVTFLLPEGSGATSVRVEAGDQFDAIPFAYAAPMIVAVYPSQAPHSGGTELTVQGINFAYPCQVKLGDLNCAVEQVGFTSLTCHVPPFPSLNVTDQVPVVINVNGQTSKEALVFVYSN